MKKRDESSASSTSPLRILLTMLAIAFLAEASVMLLVHDVLRTRHGEAFAAIANAVLLAVLSAPFLWWFVIRPLRSTAMREHARAATIVAQAVDGIITINEQGLVDSLNPAAERIFGVERQELLGKPLTLLMPARYRDAHQQALERLRSRGQPRLLGKTVEMHGLRKDGGEFPLELSLARWEAGHGTFYTGIVRDITDRKRAEERLRLQGTGLESAANAIVITDREGHITWVNPAFTRLTGYPPEEVLGQNPRILKSGIHDQAFYQNLWETILAGQVWQREITNRRKDGSLFTEQQTITPVQDERGEISHFVSINHDVSERRRTAEALRKSEERYRALFEQSPVGIFHYDTQLRLTDCNDRLLAILQSSRERAVGLDMKRLKDQSVLPALRKAIEGEVGYYDGVYRATTSSAEVWLSLRTAPLFGQDGQVLGGLGMAEDITERKQAEEALRALYLASLHIQEPLELQDRLSRLLATAREILHLDRLNILLADPEGQWLEAVVSTETEEPVEALRVPIGPEGGGIAEAYVTQQMIGWDGRGPVPERYRLKPPYDQIAAFRSQAFVNVPLVVQGRTIGVLGADRKYSRRPLEAATLELLQLFAAQAAIAIESARLYEERRQAAIRLEAEVEDRTRELRTANQQLQEASRHKSKFLANMSHELRTPLNAVIGFSEIMRDQRTGPLNEKQGRYLGHIYNSGKHLLRLISDILDLSQVEAGKIVLQLGTLPVAMSLEDILVIARELADKKRQQVDVVIEGDLPPLRADPVRFKQILFNLLSNAVKFTPDGGRISLTARRLEGAAVPLSGGAAVGLKEPQHGNTAGPQHWLEIRVADSGVGIRAEDLPRLFQEFVRLERTATRSEEGTGLGLALTKRLVELHGGRISVESEGEGRGTTFTVLLPFTGPEHPPGA